MSLLPSFMLDEVDEATLAEENQIETPREYGVDYTTGQLTGTIVEGLEAIKAWIWLTLHVERYRFPIYSWDHGCELDQYIGHGLSEEYVVESMQVSIEEALTQNEHILGVSDFEASVTSDKITMSFHVETDIGGIDVSV